MAKQKFKERVKNFAEEHMTEILMVGEFLGGLAVGMIVGENIGTRKEVEKFASHMPDMIDRLGYAGSIAALDAINEQPECLSGKRLDFDKFGSDVCRHYYDNDVVKKSLDAASKYAKKAKKK